MRRILLLLVFFVAVGDWLTIISARAVPVSTCDDAGIRAAISSGGTVTFDCDGVILLTNTLTISQNTVVDGTGHNVTISGANAVQLFHVNPGVTFSLSKLVLENGLSRGTNAGISQTAGLGGGGAIYNDGGIVMANDCVFQTNSAIGGIGAPGGNPGQSIGKGGVGCGGCLYNLGGQVTFSNCVIQASSTIGGQAGPASSYSFYGVGGDAEGGAIFTAGGSVRLVQCDLRNNTATGGFGTYHSTQALFTGTVFGGAIYETGGTVEIDGGFIRNNSCGTASQNYACGGGIYVTNGMFILIDALVATNQATGGAAYGGITLFRGGVAHGGGVCIDAGFGRVTNVTAVANTAAGGDGADASGGGLLSAGDVQSLNCTFAGNQAVAGATVLNLVGNGYGGAIASAGGSMVLTHATIASNSAVRGTPQGGGIYASNSITLQNSIVAYNASGSNCFGSIIDSGNNISSDATGGFTAPGSLMNTDPLLGPLGDYGGPLPTMSLLRGSPAIDSANGSYCPPTDARGTARPYGPACDIGAFESAPPYTIRGALLGYKPVGNVSAVGTNAPFDSNGNYVLKVASNGLCVVTPWAADTIFVPSNQTVNADVVNVNFASYRSNAFAIEGMGQGVIHLTFASKVGETYSLECSSNLIDWVPRLTNSVGTDGLSHTYLTNDVTTPTIFYRGKGL